MSLIATQIGKSYANRPIVSDVSLVINPAEVTCVIGPSGAGKTTLLRCLAGLEAPDAGQVTLDGDDIYQIPQAVIWPKMTVVFQSLFLWPHLTLAENILLPARARMAEDDLAQSFAEIVESFGMADFIHRYPNEVSGGQRQRAALARAVILRPRYMLLDEITSALDVEQIANILKILEACKARGIGILVITHLLNFAKRMADQVVFLDQGQVVEQGQVDILTKPRSERLRSFLSLVSHAS